MATVTIPGKVSPPRGRLGVLMPGLGAVATTFYAGLEAMKRGLGQPLGSLTQMGELELEPGSPRPIKKVLPLASVEDLEVGGWDVFPDDGYQAALRAGVLEKSLIEQLKPQLQSLEPMPGVFDPAYVKNLEATHIKEGRHKRHLAEQLQADIRGFVKARRVDRAVMVWSASTEVYQELGPAHQSLRAFEAALDKSDPSIAPSMIYAYAALREGLPFMNGAPNLTVDTPALQELARERQLPIAGKDFKSGQTKVKTVLAPMLKARLLGLDGWYSTNILGNRDGEVLDDPGSFRSKEVSKLSVLENILEPERYPELYGHFTHKVSINYYPPRGDNKEAWDNIDLTGWLGYPMQLKVNFLCRDSILAAPLVLDLALFADLAHRAGLHGTQSWLSFYFKSPMPVPGRRVEHDLFAQLELLRAQLREIAQAPGVRAPDLKLVRASSSLG